MSEGRHRQSGCPDTLQHGKSCRVDRRVVVVIEGVSEYREMNGSRAKSRITV
jgi:hypothetical protein